LATPCRGVANAKPGHSEPLAALKGKLREESIKNVIARRPKADAAISTSDFDIPCSIFDLLLALCLLP